MSYLPVAQPPTPPVAFVKVALDDPKSFETMKSNLELWETYAHDVKKYVKRLWKTAETVRHTDEILTLFDRYVKPEWPHKRFDPFVVEVDKQEHSLNIVYKHNGVHITYFGRNTFMSDDYNWFIDRKVVVDQQTVYSSTA